MKWVLLLAVSGLISASDLQSPMKISVEKLARSPESFVSIPSVEVEGTLKNTGKSYFKESRFELQDGRYAFEVVPWLPLEIAPPRPGMEHSTPKRAVMSDFLSKKVRLRGKVVASSEAAAEGSKVKHRLSVDSAEVLSSREK